MWILNRLVCPAREICMRGPSIFVWFCVWVMQITLRALLHVYRTYSNDRQERTQHERVTSANNLRDAINCAMMCVRFPNYIGARSTWTKAGKGTKSVDILDCITWRQWDARAIRKHNGASGEIINHSSDAFFLLLLMVMVMSYAIFYLKWMKKHIFRHSIMLDQTCGLVHACRIVTIAYTRSRSKSVDLDTDQWSECLTTGFLIAV